MKSAKIFRWSGLILLGSVVGILVKPIIATAYIGISTDVFGVHQAVVITQNYHLPRAVYTCDRLGVKTVGLGTPDVEIYGWRGMVPDLRREMLANVKALVEVNITRPRPTFLGSFEGMN